MWPQGSETESQILGSESNFCHFVFGENFGKMLSSSLTRFSLICMRAKIKNKVLKEIAKDLNLNHIKETLALGIIINVSREFFFIVYSHGGCVILGVSIDLFEPQFPYNEG